MHSKYLLKYNLFIVCSLPVNRYTNEWGGRVQPQKLYQFCLQL